MQFKSNKISRLVKRHHLLDPWFPFRFSLDLYSGCRYGCRFCPAGLKIDKIQVKGNALEVLKKELAQLPAGVYIGIGGGPAEIYQVNGGAPVSPAHLYPVLAQKDLIPFILTRNTGLLHDLKTIKTNAGQARPAVCMGIFSFNKRTARDFEPEIPPSAQRLALLKQAKAQGFITGLLLSPVIPFVNDSQEEIYTAVKAAAAAGLDFIILDFLWTHSWPKIKKLLPASAGTAAQINILMGDRESYAAYQEKVYNIYISQCRSFKMRILPPFHVFKNYLPPREAVILALLNAYYYRKGVGKKRTSFQESAFQISRITDQDFDGLVNTDCLLKIKGVGNYMDKFIKEILNNTASGQLAEMENDFFKI